MNYISSSESEINEIKSFLNISDIDNLFNKLPKEFLNPDINIDKGKDELEVTEIINNLKEKNNIRKLSFLGVGSYSHYIPPIIDYLSSRSEFLTAYTPYQPEIAQGTLKVIFEYQSYVSLLTGFEVTNASLYDGATSIAEAVRMTISVSKKNKVLVSKLLNPNYIKVLLTYLKPLDTKIDYIDSNDDLTTKANFDDLSEYACVLIQSPNFYGSLENNFFNWLKNNKEKYNKTYFIHVGNPLQFGVFENSKDLGFDIACGDMQPLGISTSFGGPSLGYIAGIKTFLRKMPGRMVGYTKDKNGKDAYVLTLQAREQHIRRNKATSNICSNQALMVLRSVIFLSILGETGFKNMSEINYYNANYFAEEINKLDKFKVINNSFFNEISVQSDISFDKIHNKLLKNNITHPYFEKERNLSIWCITELFTKNDIDNIINLLKEL